MEEECEYCTWTAKTNGISEIFVLQNVCRLCLFALWYYSLISFAEKRVKFQINCSANCVRWKIHLSQNFWSFIASSNNRMFLWYYKFNLMYNVDLTRHVRIMSDPGINTHNFPKREFKCKLISELPAHCHLCHLGDVTCCIWGEWKYDIARKRCLGLPCFIKYP